MKKLLIIGNSFIGALVAAFHKQKTIYEIDFLGSGGINFDLIDLDGDNIVGGDYSTVSTDLNLRKYDAVLIYGDLPSTQNLYNLSRELICFSSMVIHDTLNDYILSSHSCYLYNKIVARIGADRVFITSHNIKSGSNLSLQKFDSFVKFFIDLFASSYIKLPAQLVIDGVVSHHFYNNSLLLDGKLAKLSTDVSPDLLVKHDDYHLNAEGGILYLNSFFSCVEKI
jgi:hypothetical protein